MQGDQQTNTTQDHSKKISKFFSDIKLDLCWFEKGKFPETSAWYTELHCCCSDSQNIAHYRSIQEWRHAWVWSLFWLKYPRPVSSVPAVTAWHQLNSWNVQLLVTREWTELSGVSECHFIRSAAGNVADFPLFYSIIWTVAKLYCRVQNSLHMAAAPRLLYARGSGQTAQRGQCGCTECTLHQDTQIPSPEMPTLMRCSVFSGKIILIHDSGRGVICHLKAYNLSLWKSALKQCLHTSL